jgi:L-lysine 6-transaminase
MIITPDKVHEVLRQSILVDGFDLVWDPIKSHGSFLYDAKHGREFLDFFTFVVSLPLGYNHPKMQDKTFQKKLLKAALVKPTNPEIYTVEYAEFVHTFQKIAGQGLFQHYFFISGGTLAVENALKAAFDWKVRKNLKAGRGEKGFQIIHFQQAFHGRSGYCLSLTNTFDPRKTMYFPTFKWPRIINPKCFFPLEGDNLRRVRETEEVALAQIEEAIRNNPDDIAAIIIEPIQGEGGDNHFRAEFMQELRRIADQHELLLIFDEIQTGVGITGKMWAFQHFNVQPDIIAFGKKTQVSGIASTGRIDEVDNVFKIPSRISSTFGGNLVDMVRVTRYLEIIEEDKLLENATELGNYLLHGLQELTSQYSNVVSNIRGKGLFIAFDLPSSQERDRLKNILYDLGILLFGCGEKGIRLRPPLTLTRAEADQALDLIGQGLKKIYL